MACRREQSRSRSRPDARGVRRQASGVRRPVFPRRPPRRRPRHSSPTSSTRRSGATQGGSHSARSAAPRWCSSSSVSWCRALFDPCHRSFVFACIVRLCRHVCSWVRACVLGPCLCASSVSMSCVRIQRAASPAGSGSSTFGTLSVLPTSGPPPLRTASRCRSPVPQTWRRATSRAGSRPARTMRQGRWSHTSASSHREYTRRRQAQRADQRLPPRVHPRVTWQPGHAQAGAPPTSARRALSSGLTTLPVGLRGSESTKMNCRGTL